MMISSNCTLPASSRPMSSIACKSGFSNDRSTSAGATMGANGRHCAVGVVPSWPSVCVPTTRSIHRGDPERGNHDLSSRPALLEVDPAYRRSTDAGSHGAGEDHRGDRRSTLVRSEVKRAAKSAMFAFPPRQMRCRAAAHYCDLSESTFLARVASGEYPPGAKDGGARVWLRDDLDAAIEARFGVKAIGGRIDDEDPFAARLSN